MFAFVDTPIELLAVQAAFQVPAEIIILGYSLRLFDIRNKLGFVLFAVALFLGTSLLADHFPNYLRLAMGLIVFVVPQMLFAKDSIMRKLFTATVIQLAIVLAEIPPSVYWLGVAEVAPGSVEALTQYSEYLILARIIHLSGLILLLMGTEIAQRRITDNRTERGSLFFFSFIVVQYFLLALGVFAIEATHIFSASAAVGLACVGALCLVADVICFAMLDRYNRSEREYQRMLFFQEQLDRYLEGYEGIEREVSAIARIRHDLRNQISVVLYFLDQDDATSAREHVNVFAERLREDEEASQVEEASMPPLEEVVPSDRLGVVGSLTLLEGGARHDARHDARTATSRLNPQRNPRYFEYLFGVFPLSQIASLGFLLGYAAAVVLPAWFYLVIALGGVLCVLSDLVLFRVITEYQKRGAVESQARLMEEQAHVQKLYYERLSTELKEAATARHRLVKQLFAIEGEIAQGNIEKVRELLKETASTPSFVGERFCENRVVNALLSLKANAMAAEDIEFKCAVAVPDDLPVPSVDLCALFSNLLDNALAACRQIEEGERAVSLSSKYAAGVFAVDMVNSCVDQPHGKLESSSSAKKRPSLSSEAKAWDLARLAGLPDEGKPFEVGLSDSLVKSHGWGLQILHDLADRYDGAFASSHLPEGSFRTTVMLVLRSC